MELNIPNQITKSEKIDLLGQAFLSSIRFENALSVFDKFPK